MHTLIHTYTYTYTHTDTHIGDTGKYTCSNDTISASCDTIYHMHIHIYMYIHTHTYACEYIYTHTYIHNIYAYIYIHTYHVHLFSGHRTSNVRRVRVRAVHKLVQRVRALHNTRTALRSFGAQTALYNFIPHPCRRFSARTKLLLRVYTHTVFFYSLSLPR